jgi:hypothetical protein
MAQLPEIILPTIEAIYTYYKIHAGDHRRDHLGASQIGQKCDRRLWFDFHWCSNPNHNGRLLRLFESGNVQEPRLVKNLRDIGITVYDKDPDTDSQIHYEMYGGHYSGSLDGVGQGFAESSKWHVLEFKTSSLKAFNKLKKDGVKDAKFEHYCQMNQYMSWAELERAYYFCVCKDTDEIYGERIHLDKELVKRLQDKAKRIVFADVPSTRISENEDSPDCLFCPHVDICFGNRIPDVSCRTCAFANPEETGIWMCTRDDTRLCNAKQREILPCHVFIPQLIPLEQTDADPDKGTITYDDITNGPGEIPSTEMQRLINGTP